MGNVGLFFCVRDKFLFHGCDLQEAEIYGNFKGYPNSHFEIWDKLYYKKFKVDFDYYPRGRIVYDMSNKRFLVYRDSCILDEMMEKFLKDCEVEPYILLKDEHYQCKSCNLGYIDISSRSFF